MGALAVVVAVAGALANVVETVANSTAVIASMFNGSWLLFAVMTVAVLSVVVGVILLPRLAIEGATWPARGVVALIVVGALTAGWSLGTLPREDARTDPATNVATDERIGTEPGTTTTTTATTGPATSTTTPTTTTSAPPTTTTTTTTALPAAPPPGQRLTFVDLQNDATVEFREYVGAVGRDIAPQQRLMVFLRVHGSEDVWIHPCERDAPGTERFTCGIQFGDPESTGTVFFVWLVVVDENSYQRLTAMRNAGSSFNLNAPPVAVLAESERVRVIRR